MLRDFCVPLQNMKFEIWFSQKMRLRKSVSASTSTGTVIAIAGVALALMVMELSLAISTGFKDEIRAKVMGFEAPVAVLPPYDVATASSADEFEPKAEIFETIQRVIPGARASASISRQAILKTDSSYLAVKCIAHDSLHDASFEAANITGGYLPTWRRTAASDSIVISGAMAKRLDLAIGDKLYMYFFIDQEVKARRVYVAGTYTSNFSDFDNSVVYTSYVLQERLHPDTTLITSIDIENIAEHDIDRAAADLQDAFVESYREGESAALYPVTDVHRTGALYFNWLDLLDTNVVVIFILMLAVAAFTLISSLFIIILDRVSTIGLLRALGASKSTVTNIFIATAMRLVGFGILIGNVAGLGLAGLQQMYEIVPLNPEMYYLDHVPVEINWAAILALNAGVVLAAWLILILPARLAARIDPSSTMRYE